MLKRRPFYLLALLLSVWLHQLRPGVACTTVEEDTLFKMINAHAIYPVSEQQRQSIIKDMMQQIAKLEAAGFKKHSGPITKNIDWLDGRLIVGILKIRSDGAVELFGGYPFGFETVFGEPHVELYTTDRIMRQYPLNFIQKRFALFPAYRADIHKTVPARSLAPLGVYELEYCCYKACG